MRVLPYALYLFLIAFYRTNLLSLFSIGPIQIYLSALLVILVALNKDDLTALWFGLAVGFIYDAPNPEFLGTHMIILSLVGIATSIIKQRFNLESMKSLILLVIVGLLVYSIPYTIIYVSTGAGEFFRFTVERSLGSVAYTALLGWLFFMFQSGRLSYQKLKSIF